MTTFEPPYFEYVDEVVFDELGERDDRPESRDVIFKFPKESFGYHRFKVRFHGRKDNRFITCFPKPFGHTEDKWEKIEDKIDFKAAVLSAIAYLERTHGVVTKDFNNCPSYLRP